MKIGDKVQVIGLGGDLEGRIGKIVGEARFKYALGDWLQNWIVRFQYEGYTGQHHLHPNWLRSP